MTGTVHTLDPMFPTIGNVDSCELSPIDHRTIQCRIIADIQRQEAEYAGITLAQIFGHDRHQNIVRARHRAMQRAYFEVTMDLVALGRAFDRDRSTVYHAICKPAVRKGAG